VYSKELKPYYNYTKRPLVPHMTGEFEYFKSEVRNHENTRGADNRCLQTRQYYSRNPCGAKDV
jgi:hypothetical protein